MVPEALYSEVLFRIVCTSGNMHNLLWSKTILARVPSALVKKDINIFQSSDECLCYRKYPEITEWGSSPHSMTFKGFSRVQ